MPPKLRTCSEHVRSFGAPIAGKGHWILERITSLKNLINTKEILSQHFISENSSGPPHALIRSRQARKSDQRPACFAKIGPALSRRWGETHGDDGGDSSWMDTTAGGDPGNNSEGNLPIQFLGEASLIQHRDDLICFPE